jgi:hypothetical protein
MIKFLNASHSTIPKGISFVLTNLANFFLKASSLSNSFNNKTAKQKQKQNQKL